MKRIGLTVLALILIPHGAGAGSLPPHSRLPDPLPTRADTWFGAAAVAGVLAVSLADQRIRQATRFSGGDEGRRLSDLVGPLGTPQVLAPGLLLAMGAGRLFDRPGLTHASFRIATAVTVAGAATGALKLSVGRSRPAQSIGDHDDFLPFSGHDSFPSGHTALAFAAATAIDRETGAGWVPWVVYPLAGLVGWSRLHDDRHWASDVFGAGVLGYWTAEKVKDFTGFSTPSPGRLRSLVSGRGRALRLGLGFSF